MLTGAARGAAGRYVRDGRELLRVLRGYGLERIDVTEGDEFDLAIHQTLDGLDVVIAPGTPVIGVQRQGYRLRGAVLRRAAVKVAG